MMLVVYLISLPLLASTHILYMKINVNDTHPRFFLHGVNLQDTRARFHAHSSRHSVSTRVELLINLSARSKLSKTVFAAVLSIVFSAAFPIEHPALPANVYAMLHARAGDVPATVFERTGEGARDSPSVFRNVAQFAAAEVVPICDAENGAIVSVAMPPVLYQAAPFREAAINCCPEHNSTYSGRDVVWNDSRFRRGRFWQTRR